MMVYGKTGSSCGRLSQKGGCFLCIQGHRMSGRDLESTAGDEMRGKKVWVRIPWNPGEARDASYLYNGPDIFFSWHNFSVVRLWRSPGAHGVVRSRQGTGLFPMSLLFPLPPWRPARRSMRHGT